MNEDQTHVPTVTGGPGIQLGRDFFREIIRPTMERACPGLLAVAACGRFGWGSECFGMDDAVSRDHHWGPRVDILLPDDVAREEAPRILREVGAQLPGEYRGFKLEPGHVGAAGLSPEGIDSFLRRTIGRTTLPETDHDWLEIPEEDIVHVTNGELWHDPLGRFGALRRGLAAYYPDRVWRRRMAHWCRYASGMGIYAVHRALLRGNKMYAHTAFARSLKLAVELAYMLNRVYFPYDKWLLPMFGRLPRLAAEMLPLIDEATADAVDWERRMLTVERMHDLIDGEMTAQGLVPPHPRYKRSPTSGYRILEWDYYHLLRSLPREIREHTPLTEQRHFESFTVEYVAPLEPADWLHMLNLEEA